KFSSLYNLYAEVISVQSTSLLYTSTCMFVSNILLSGKFHTLTNSNRKDHANFLYIFYYSFSSSFTSSCPLHFSRYVDYNVNNIYKRIRSMDLQVQKRMLT